MIKAALMSASIRRARRRTRFKKSDFARLCGLSARTFRNRELSGKWTLEEFARFARYGKLPSVEILKIIEVYGNET